MESQLVRLVIAAFIGFILTVRAVPGEPPNFSPETARNWVESPVPAPSPEYSPPSEPIPANSPSPEITPAPVRLVVAPPRSVPPPYRLSRRMSPPPREPGKAPPAPPEGEGALNEGKRVGLLFAGMAATLQVFMVAYIIYKRRQIF